MPTGHNLKGGTAPIDTVELNEVTYGTESFQLGVKLEAVKMVLARGISAAQVARDLGIQQIPTLRYTWTRAADRYMALISQTSVQSAVAMPVGVRVTQSTEFAEAIKRRLRLRVRPLIEHFAGQLLVGIELKARPIVFFWLIGWAGHGD